MRPIRWVRNNRNKLMAAFVVVIMIAFIMPPAFQQLAQGRVRKAVIAYYGDDSSITNISREEARQELIMLRQLFAPQLLALQQDVNLQLLGQVLFFDPEVAAAISGNLKEAFASVSVPASNAEIDDFFHQLADTDSANLWILLNAEADRAGMASSKEEAAQILSEFIPRLPELRGVPFREYMTWLISQGISEEEALTTYAKLIKVFRYAQLKTSQELVTTNQLKAIVRNRTETMDPNVVRIDASVFLDPNAAFTQEQLTGQFEAFKNFLEGDYTDENPYGFGYRLPSRVQLEYLILNMDDVRRAVPRPGMQEMQAHYQENKDSYTEMVPDPADPNNPERRIARVRPYSEVADEIEQTLHNQHVQTRANAILAEAERLIEQGLEGASVETISDARYRELVGSYEEAAAAMTEKHGVKLYAGRTGMLSASDFYFGRRGHAGSLHMEHQVGAATPLRNIPLRNIAFAVGKLDGVQLGPFDIATPRMYETIGPFNDTILERVKAIVRVVEARSDEAPTDLDVSYSIAGIRLDEPVSEDDVHSVRRAVTRDLQVLEAMARAGEKANELKSLGAGEDWGPTLRRWNEKYGTPENREPFAVQPLGTIRRPSALDAWVETQRLQRSFDAARQKAMRRRPRLLAARLFELLPAGATAPTELPAVVKFEPVQAYFVIRDMTLENQATTLDYEAAKALGAYYADVIQGQAFALVHFSPRNIKQRMGYRLWADRELAAAIDAITYGDYGSDEIEGRKYVDPVGGRFRVILPEGWSARHGTEVTYRVPTAMKDGQVIPMGGQTLQQSMVDFRTGELKVNVRVRQSYWDDFDRDMQDILTYYDARDGRIESRLTKIDEARAIEIISLERKKITMALLFKKDGHDHLITITCPAGKLPMYVQAIRGFLDSYRTMAREE
ncbi:MAG TPA: hypothetical protein VLH60_07405 [Sedimentisphaerales bacterium]|nr:hypothetical protein [Sedimentisphaerales bacterium]